MLHLLYLLDFVFFFDTQSVVDYAFWNTADILKCASTRVENEIRVSHEQLDAG